MPHNGWSSTHRLSRVSHVASHVNHAPQRAVKHAPPVLHIPRCLRPLPCVNHTPQWAVEHAPPVSCVPHRLLHKPHPTMGGRACTARLTCPHPSLNSEYVK